MESRWIVRPCEAKYVRLRTMKRLLCLLCSIAIVGCDGSDAESKNNIAQSLRHRNLALAYIDKGMMIEASEK